MLSYNELINGKGIIIIQAHPFREVSTPAVEVYNGHPRHNSNNHLALQYALDNSLRQLSGSDFHQACDIARGGIILSERITADNNFASVIANNRIQKLIRSTEE